VKVGLMTLESFWLITVLISGIYSLGIR